MLFSFPMAQLKGPREKQVMDFFLLICLMRVC